MVQKFGGAWSKEKLERVEAYFRLFNTALKNQSFSRVYIDTFAGAGGHETSENAETDASQSFFDDIDEEASNFLTGSTLRALEVEPSFHRFIFSDLLHRNFRSLNALQERYPNRSIETNRGDANTITREVLQGINWKASRAVLFLDPKGAQVDWETLRVIADTNAIDMWYLFPSGTVLRMLKKSGDIPEDWRNRLNRLLGTENWETEFYTESKQIDLFGTDRDQNRHATIVDIEDYLIRRLGEVFPHVAPKCLTLHNSKNSPLFSLCFAAANKGKGGQLAKKLATAVLG